MKKIFSIILTIIVTTALFLVTSCSCAYSCAGCIDKAGREVCASCFENTGCFNDSCRMFSCFYIGDCYDELNVDCPSNCANSIRNDYDSNSCANCFANYAEQGAEITIDKYDYKYYHTVEFDNDSVSSTYYKAKVKITINPKKDMKNVVCDFTFYDNLGNSSDTKLFFGNMKAGEFYDKTATFVFKGYSSRNPNHIKNFVLTGSYGK